RFRHKATTSQAARCADKWRHNQESLICIMDTHPKACNYLRVRIVNNRIRQEMRYRRYDTLALSLLLGLAAAASSAQTAKQYNTLTLAGPAAVVTYPLLHMVETGALAQYTDNLTFRLWQNPDQLRVLLAKKEIDFSATPSNLPALMANR